MIKTILFLAWLGILFVLTIVPFILYLLLLLFSFLPVPFFTRLREGYLEVLSSWWARHMLKVTGSKVTLSGLENVPETDSICIISNHQGMADIPLILGYIPKNIGFIAKKEMAGVPLITWWMWALGCMFIDRKNVRAASKIIDKAVEKIQKGHAMMIFPEGTRSKSNTPGTFRTGSLKLATRADAIILPVTLINSWQVFEEHNKIKSANVSMIIHKPLYPETYREWKKTELAENLQKIIAEPLKDK